MPLREMLTLHAFSLETQRKFCKYMNYDNFSWTVIFRTMVFFITWYYMYHDNHTIKECVGTLLYWLIKLLKI